MFVILPLSISLGTIALYIWNPPITESAAATLAVPAMVIPGLLALIHIGLSLRVHQRIEAGYGLMYALASVLLFTGAGYAYALLIPVVAALLLAGSIAQAIERSVAESAWALLLGIMVIGMAAIVLLEPEWTDALSSSDLSPFAFPITASDVFALLFLVVAIAVLLLPPYRIRSMRLAHVCAMPILFVFLHRDRIIEVPRFPFLAEATASAIFVILLLGLTQLYWRHAFIDELTGLSNRRSLEERLKVLGRSFSIAMVDIDHFKSFNDTYGHAEGDNVLRWVAGILRKAASSTVYRYGGEEFCVVYRGMAKGEAAQNTESIREGVEQGKFYIRGHQSGGRRSGSRKGRGKSGRRSPVSVTISCGVAQSTRDNRDPYSVISAADRALYKAKADGRNRVCVATQRRTSKK